ncbi:MAG TPA: DUF885 family protein [Anaerolineae bacterium]|nr:DUF885 family protein [Anaerolineae bacterium]
MRKAISFSFMLSLILVGSWLGACGAEQTPTDSALQATARAEPEEQTTLQATEAPVSHPTDPLPTVTEPAPTATPTIVLTPTETRPDPSSVAGIAASLQGLPLEEFFEESYKQLILRIPEHLTAMGLSETFGLRDDRLTNLSVAYLQETQELEENILALLRAYDRESLTDEERVSYDVYEWYLDNQIRGHTFMYHNYPLNHFLGSYHFELDSLFTEIHPLASRQNVEDYIARLSQVIDQVEQLMEGLRVREELGVIPPTFIIDLARQDMIRYLGMRSPDPSAIRPEFLRVFTRFSEGIEELDELSAGEKQQFREAALREIEASFVPAYLSLLDYLDHLRPLATDDAGVWKLSDGDAYYAYLLRQETTTELTPAEIHETGLAEVDRIKGEMRQVFADLGYPEDASLRTLMARAVDEGGYLDISTQSGKDRYIAAIKALIAEVDEELGAVFDARPQGQVIVVGGPAGGYYVAGAPDGSRPGSYHVSLVGNWRPKYSMPTIAYHEAIPGHHFQIALAQESNLPLFQNDVGFNAYIEGWAMYGERLAWELGLYDDDPYGNLGRLQYELLRAVRLVTDTGIHAMRWTREQAQDYMDEAMGAGPGSFSHEVDRYVVMPAQATSYKIGLIKLLELRQRAMDQLGDQFDIKDFHNVVLGNGSMPLDILERVVQDYIDARLASAASPPPPTSRSAQDSFIPTAVPANTPIVGIIRDRPGDYYDRLLLRNYPRWFKVHVPPSYQPGEATALVFNLHGLGMNLEQQELLSNMSVKADEAGFIVVYPQGGASVWNVQAGNIGAIDVSFFREMIDHLRGRLSIDPARIFVTGFSNGGGMAHRLACDLSDWIAAIAPVSGAHAPNQPCDPERPVPVLAIHGTEDRSAPYANEQLGHNIPRWAAAWAARNKCDPKPESTKQGSLTVETWGNCQAGATVTLYSVEDMGHVWPDFPKGDVFGPDTSDVVANDLIWEFFDAHPMP